MSYNTLSELFKGICDAIRTKDGTSDEINHQDIPERILALESSDSVVTEEEWTMPVLSADEQTVDGITYLVSADSSHVAAMSPYMAFNGNYADTLATQGQSWHSAKAGTQGTHWLMIDVSEAVKVESLTFHHRYTALANENHNVKEFIFECSEDDGETWAPLLFGTCEGTPATEETFAIVKPDYVKKYRLRIVNTYSSNASECYAVIGELELTGKKKML